MPLVVVSDSSPIRALHHLGLLSLCAELYGSVIVPEAVQQELSQATSTCSAIAIAEHPGFEVKSPVGKPSDLGVPSDFDPGEIEAITLAIELPADLLLMDERKGTKAARKLGLATIGVFGVLLEGKRKGHISHVIPYVDRLVAELRFFASPAVRKELAQLAGE